MNLHSKLIEIRKTVVNFTKDTEGYGYKYVSGSQVISKIREKMDELGVLLYPSTDQLENYTYDYVNGKGQEKTDHVVKGSMTYTWVDANNPDEKIVIPWSLYGAQDDISKAFGSGLTYSERYFLLKFFQAPTDELDPDGRDTSNNKSNKNRKGPSEAQMKRLYTLAKIAGYDKDKINSMIWQKYKKRALELTNEEYNSICDGLEKNAK